MFEEVFASALYMMVLFFGVMIAFIILTGYYWSRQIRTIHLKKHAHNKNKDQHNYAPF
jgi:cell division protein FtsI/penicillin-binding protein 2